MTPMTSRRFILWMTVGVLACIGAGTLWSGNLAGIIPLIVAVPAAVVTVRRILHERQLRRELHDWLDRG